MPPWGGDVRHGRLASDLCRQLVLPPKDEVLVLLRPFPSFEPIAVPPVSLAPSARARIVGCVHAVVEGDS